jgi:hypothetical protein
MSESIVRIPHFLLVEFIQKAYDLSQPQGMGLLHFRPGSLSQDEALQIIHKGDGRTIHMDYVHGRAVKLTIPHDIGGHYIKFRDTNPWYDHTPQQFNELLRVLRLDK